MIFFSTTRELERCTLVIMEMHEIRRRNFAAHIEHVGSQAAVAEMLGCDESWVSQLKTGTAKISEKSARKYEKLLSLPSGRLDFDASAVESAISPDMADRLVNRLLEMDGEEREYWTNVILSAPRRR